MNVFRSTFWTIFSRSRTDLSRASERHARANALAERVEIQSLSGGRSDVTHGLSQCSARLLHLDDSHEEAAHQRSEIALRRRFSRFARRSARNAAGKRFHRHHLSARSARHGQNLLFTLLNQRNQRQKFNLCSTGFGQREKMFPRDKTQDRIFLSPRFRI